MGVFHGHRSVENRELLHPVEVLVALLLIVGEEMQIFGEFGCALGLLDVDVRVRWKKRSVVRTPEHDRNNVSTCSRQDPMRAFQQPHAVPQLSDLYHRQPNLYWEPMTTDQMVSVFLIGQLGYIGKTRHLCRSLPCSFMNSCNSLHNLKAASLQTAQSFVFNSISLQILLFLFLCSCFAGHFRCFLHQHRGNTSSAYQSRCQSSPPSNPRSNCSRRTSKICSCAR